MIYGYARVSTKGQDKYGNGLDVQEKQLRENGATIIYPYVSNKYGLCLDTNEVRSNKTIQPNSEVVIPIKCEFYFSDKDDVTEISKYLSFDIKTSLYKDPVNYLVRFTAKLNDTVDDKVFRTHKSSLLTKILNPIKYRIIGQ